MATALTCSDFERLGLWHTRRCCPACHAEMDRGAGQLEIEPEPNRRGVEASVRLIACCNFYPGLDVPLNREVFAQALVARRALHRTYRALVNAPAVNDVSADELAPYLSLVPPLPSHF